MGLLLLVTLLSLYFSLRIKLEKAVPLKNHNKKLEFIDRCNGVDRKHIMSKIKSGAYIEEQKNISYKDNEIAKEKYKVYCDKYDKWRKSVNELYGLNINY